MWSDLFHDRDIILISPQRWGGMWVSKHWIASELAKHNRVLFVEPPIWVGGLVKRPRGLALEWKRLVPRVRRVQKNLFVHAPWLWPERFGPHAESLTRQVRGWVERLGFRACVALNFSTNHFYIHQLHDITSVHYCVDPPFPQLGEEQFEALTCQKSDLVYAISEAYQRKLARHDPNKPVLVVPHGFAFEQARRIHDEPTAPPRELAGLEGPIYGYVGSVHDAYVDIGLLEWLSARKPSAHFVLVGPYKHNPIGPDLSAEGLKRLRRLPNVHLLGFRPYHDLPRYVKHFDAGLVLVEIDRFASAHATRSRTHFKLLHYLAQGKPIVLPDVYEVSAIRDLVAVARDREEYARLLDAVLLEDEDVKRRRVEYASGFSYEKVLDQIVRPIVDYEQKDRSRIGPNGVGRRGVLPSTGRLSASH
jgi:hypothetical protein